MALFNSKEKAPKETKEQKQERKINEMMEKYGLQNLSPEYRSAVKDISVEISGNGLLEFGTLLSGMKSEDRLKISYLNALVQQNWIIMRQLDEISTALRESD